MDQALLVRRGKALLRALDSRNVPPRFAAWVRYPDPDQWKLWIVPHPSIDRTRKFYSHVAQALQTSKRPSLSPLDIAEVEMVPESRLGITPDRPFFSIGPDGSPVSARNVFFDGVFYPEVIFLRVPA